MQSSPHLWVRASCPLPSFSTCEFSRFGTKRTKANALISICLFFIASAILFHRHSFFVSFTGAKLVFFFAIFQKTCFIFVIFLCSVQHRCCRTDAYCFSGCLWILSVEYLLRLQTRLLYEADKASLYCKTNLFAVQGSLVCVWGVCVLWLSGLGVKT